MFKLKTKTSQVLLPLALLVASIGQLSPAFAVSTTQKSDSVISKEHSGLKTMLMLTLDKNWQEIWDAVDNKVPEFRTSTEVYLGETLTMLAFVSGLKADKQGNVDIHCSIQLVDPKGKIQVNQPMQPCLQGEAPKLLTNLYMLPAGASILAEKSDQPGRWTVHYQVIDKVRNIQIELKNSFDLIPTQKPAKLDQSNVVKEHQENAASNDAASNGVQPLHRSHR